MRVVTFFGNRILKDDHDTPLLGNNSYSGHHLGFYPPNGSIQ